MTRTFYPLALLLLAAGCPPSKEQRCAERGLESTYGKSLGTVCVERRPDGMGVLLLLPDERLPVSAAP